ncbi:hypothetical protein PG993_011715 [Apiospora rasikravindrae]|uniref:Uncharacterized protein n=1 Tax=Apiospora rasikravindrae TaxID=990691 RepID=A0ABR1S0F5_9PEZI
MAGTTVQPKTTPDASGLIKRFFQGFARLDASLSIGKNSLIFFIERLMWLEHDVPDSLPDPSDVSNVTMLKLWLPGVVDPNPFRIYNEELLSAGVNKYLSEAGLRWRNYQSALALITKFGLTDCSFLCGLRDILPPRDTKAKYPTPNVMCGLGPADIGGKLSGAAIWIVEKEMATWIYARCMEKEKTEEGKPQDTWSKENWEAWKV